MQIIGLFHRKTRPPVAPELSTFLLVVSPGLHWAGVLSIRGAAVLVSRKETAEWLAGHEEL